MLVVAALSAVVALALTLWLGNAGAPQATECPVQAERAAKIDAAAIGQLAALNGTGQGRGYADMAFTDAAGKPMTIADFAGKKLLVNFWASWCVPCRAEMPELDALAAKYNGDDFMVLPINLDIGEGGLEKAKAFLAEGELPAPAALCRSDVRGVRAAEDAGGGHRAAGDAAARREGLRARRCCRGRRSWDSPDGHNVIEALLGVGRRQS